VTELGPGIYERLITEGLRTQLDELAKNMPVDERPLNSADASDRIAWHVSQQVERALLDVGDEQRVRIGLQVARALLDRLGELVDVDQQAVLADPGSVLHAILRRNPDHQPQRGSPRLATGPVCSSSTSAYLQEPVSVRSRNASQPGDIDSRRLAN